MAKTASGPKAPIRSGPPRRSALLKGAANAIRTPLTQDPHAVRDTREKVLEVAIGREVRAFRKKLGITVADLAAATDISARHALEDREWHHLALADDACRRCRGPGRAVDGVLPPLRGRTQRASSSRPERGSMSNGAARARAISTICSAISAPTPAASWSSPI